MSSKPVEPSVLKKGMSFVRSNLALISLIIIGIISIPLYAIPRQPWELGSHLITVYRYYTPAVILYLIAALIVWRSKRLGMAALYAILILGFGSRAVLVTAGPFFSSDINRYVWDGRVQAARINPYIYIPADPHLAALRDEKVYPSINRKEYAPTLYPPAAQVIFLTTYLIGGMSVTSMKISMLLFEGITTLFLILIFRRLKQPPVRVLFYLWNPLIIWELASSGHIDSAMIAMLAIAVWAYLTDRAIVTGIFFALATWVKLYPAILFPAFYKKWDWKMPVAAGVTTLALFAPYLAAGKSLLAWTDHYFSEEAYVSGNRYYLYGKILAMFPGFSLNAYVVLGMIGLMAAGMVIILRRRETTETVVGDILALITLWMVIDSPHFPWYFTWLAFAAAIKPRPSYILLSVLGFADYVGWVEQEHPGIQAFVNDFKFTIFYTTLVAENLWSSRLGRDLKQWLQVKTGRQLLPSET